MFCVFWGVSHQTELSDGAVGNYIVRGIAAFMCTVYAFQALFVAGLLDPGDDSYPAWTRRVRRLRLRPDAETQRYAVPPAARRTAGAAPPTPPSRRITPPPRRTPAFLPSASRQSMKK